ncbi:MAG TPA: AEC family transporter [Deltaproteobacteria bacterium]|nr:AEC family transporter [Deltaproteobacteria bacterium]HQI80599.1 AEC family transporter [Deltaproteobacteria bacterium]
MDTTARFILFQTLIVVPFIAGAAAKRSFRFDNLPVFTKGLVRINLILIEPVIVLWSTWGLTLAFDLVWLPLSGLLLVCTGMAFGGLFRRMLCLSERGGATFLVSSSLANHGFTMGAFLCYLLLGERGLGLSFLFLSYFMPFVFLVIFPYARRVSTGTPFSMTMVRDYFLSLQNMPLFAMLVALALLGAGMRRPGITFPVDLFIIVSMALYYFTLGLNFAAPVFTTSLRPNAALACVKFVLVPLAAILTLRYVTLDPRVEMVILVQSFMPAAIYSVVASVLFDLDAELASTMFVWNTLLFLMGVLPALFFFRSTLMVLIS